jgi:uncharacterized membrane protein YgcG
MKKLMLLTGVAGLLFATTAAFAAEDTATNATATAAAADQTPQPSDQTPQPGASDQAAAPAAVAPEAPATAPIAAPVVPAVVAKTPPPTVAPGSQGLIMNFRTVPLDQVLNYMSKVAGYIIHTTTDISGSVTVWNDQPMSKDEAIILLKKVLAEKGYGVVVDGRTLTVMTLLEVKKKGILVEKGGDPEGVPNIADMRTQIVPIHTLNVVQLVKELQPLQSPEATFTADEAANALVMTDTSANIHHMLEIISALDNINSGAATVKVYPLKYADAKSLVGMIKDIFPPADNSTTGGRGNLPGLGGGGGRRGGGGFGGAGGGGNPFAALLAGGASDDSGHTPTAKVNATSDDHGNALIVSAPDALIPTIDDLVSKLDVPIEDATLVQVFKLKNADPGEMAILLTSLYPDDTGTDASRSAATFVGGRGGAAGGRGGFGAVATGGGATSTQSAYMKKLSHVGAVPDMRTKSLVVTAGKDVMPGIIDIVNELDSQSRGIVKAYHIDLVNADPAIVQSILQEQFQSFNNQKTTATTLTTGLSPVYDRNKSLSQTLNTAASTQINSSASSSAGR